MVDAGAGIGRVAKNLLLHHFKFVDLVEPNAAYIEQAQKSIDPDRIRKTFCHGLQDFHPEPETYDLVWIQWAALYLTDDDLVSFLKRIVASLRPGGVLCLKENISDEEFVLDREDRSVTRSDGLMKTLFERAGLKILAERTQPDFPEDIFEVKMYALR